MLVNLVFHNSEVFIFDEKECSHLRRNYRIIGEFSGTINEVSVLPLKLSPEEVAFVLERNLGKVVSYKSEQKGSAQLETKLLEEQQVIYKESRKRQLENIFPTIIAAKRSKGDNRSESEVFAEELDKSSQVTADKMIWPIMLKHQDIIYENQAYNIYEYTTLLRCMVFKDLWERGYYITPGQKFGGDFLVYLGDPILYHAIFIVRCVEDIEEPMHSLEIVAFGRLGTSVKKRSILAAIVEGAVSYVTINWIDD